MLDIITKNIKNLSENFSLNILNISDDATTKILKNYEVIKLDYFDFNYLEDSDKILVKQNIMKLYNK
ncbi:MAG: hypothetical protein GX053_07570 [Tissierella sp.]|nr:hypothetical protein [Tissierella sp.]